MGHIDPAQLERIAKLNEEASEVGQVVSKVILHGFTAVTPYCTYDNKGDLEREIGDFFSAVDLMIKAGDLDYAKIMEYKATKDKVITRYMVHQSE